MIRIALIAALIALPASAIAGAGDTTERLTYRGEPSFKELKCPEGSHLFVQDGAQGVEEVCLTPDGKRVGYYLRWHEDGSSWAVLGRYQSGRRHGRWVQFDQSGEKLGVAYYDKGRLKKKQDF